MLEDPTLRGPRRSGKGGWVIGDTCRIFCGTKDTQLYLLNRFGELTKLCFSSELLIEQCAI